MNGEYFLHLALALLLAPLFTGIINRVKAKVAGRHGKPLLQLYYDLFKLLRRGEVRSTSSTWVFAVAPALGLAATLCALALLPLGGAPSPLRFQGDFFLAAYLLGLGRFAMILAALDTASPFESMGASREACFSALAEPALFLCFLTLANIAIGTAGGTADAPSLSLSSMFAGQAPAAWLSGRAELALIPVALFALLLVENCRIPADDPTTHLELTMIHEAMILDHSGPNLALILYGAALKLWLFAGLTAGMLLPALPFWPALLCHLAAMFVLAALVGLVESVMARLRLVRVPRLIGGAGALAALTLILSHVR